MKTVTVHFQLPDDPQYDRGWLRDALDQMETETGITADMVAEDDAAADAANDDGAAAATSGVPGDGAGIDLTEEDKQDDERVA